MFWLSIDEPGKYPWPTLADVNLRLRRVITGYQRVNKREQLKQDKTNRVSNIGICRRDSMCCFVARDQLVRDDSPC